VKIGTIIPPIGRTISATFVFAYAIKGAQ